MFSELFVEGLEVYLDDTPGTIQFIGKSYMTVCIANYGSKVRDVCILVYENQLHKIRVDDERKINMLCHF